MNPEELLLSNLPLIERIVAFSARRMHLAPADREELLSLTRLKLLENDYDVLRRFEGRSSLSTYLATVINHIGLDFRTAQWGKWRPSAAAKRLGAVAVEYERLTTRDSLSGDEAIEVLLNQGDSLNRLELERMAESLPLRTPRPRPLDDSSALDSLPSTDASDEALFKNEAAARACVIAHLVESELAALPPQDRLILRLRFRDALPLSAIARTLGLDQPALYKKAERMLSELKDRIEARGISGSEIRQLLPEAFGAVDLDIFSDKKESSTPRPSDRAENMSVSRHE